MNTSTLFTKKQLLEQTAERLETLHVRMSDASPADRCNIKKTLTAWETMARYLNAVSDKFQSYSSVYTDKENGARYANIGDVSEFILYALKTGKLSCKNGLSRQQGFDHISLDDTGKRVTVEYKACFSNSSKNTPFKPMSNGKYAQIVLLATPCGIYAIPSETALELMDARGRFKPIDYSEYNAPNMVGIVNRLNMAVFGE